MVLENTYRASRTEALARQNASYVEKLRNQHARAHITFAQESKEGRINQPRPHLTKRRVLHIKARRNPSGAVAPLRVNGRYRVIEDGPFVDEKAALQLQSMMQGERNRLYHMQPYAVVLSSRIFQENEDGFLGERDDDRTLDAYNVPRTMNSTEEIRARADAAHQSALLGPGPNTWSRGIPAINSTASMWTKPEDVILSSVGLKSRGEWRQRWGKHYNQGRMEPGSNNENRRVRLHAGAVTGTGKQPNQIDHEENRGSDVSRSRNTSMYSSDSGFIQQGLAFCGRYTT